MRVTQKAVNRTYLYGVNRNLSDYQASTNRMNTGRKFSKISENVTSGARALKVRTSLARNTQYIENIENTADKIEQAEDLMMNMSDWMQTVNERLIQANGPAIGPDEKKIIAQEIRGYMDDILQAINTKSTDEYVFGGNDNSQPISIENGKVLFRGVDVDSSANRDDFNDKNVYVDVGFGLKFDEHGNLDETSVVQASTSALDVLGFGTSEVDGTTMSNNILSVLNQVADKLDSGANMEEIVPYQKQISNIYNKFLIQVTEVGNRSKFLEDNKGRIESEITGLKTRQTDLEAVKYEEEIIYNNTYYMAYQASLQLGSKILPQSLFNFI